MAQKKQTYRVFFENNERAQKLHSEDYDVYLRLVSYMMNHEIPIIEIDVYMAEAIKEFEQARTRGKTASGVAGKDFKEYVRKLKKQTKLKEALEVRRKNDYEKYIFSGIWLTICSFLVLLFVKEVLTGHYLIDYYIDLVVAAVALYLGASNFYQHHKIIKRWNFSNKAWIMDIMGIVVSLIVVLFTLRSPFDVTFLILVAAHLTGRKLIKNEFANAL